MKHTCWPVLTVADKVLPGIVSRALGHRKIWNQLPVSFQHGGNRSSISILNKNNLSII